MTFRGTTAVDPAFRVVVTLVLRSGSEPESVHERRGSSPNTSTALLHLIFMTESGLGGASWLK